MPRGVRSPRVLSTAIITALSFTSFKSVTFLSSEGPAPTMIAGISLNLSNNLLTPAELVISRVLARMFPAISLPP